MDNDKIKICLLSKDKGKKNKTLSSNRIETEIYLCPEREDNKIKDLNTGDKRKTFKPRHTDDRSNDNDLTNENHQGAQQQEAHQGGCVQDQPASLINI
ncbi:MAG: hypothetical protein HC888_04320 [Candidatus Competibacteraceae bacterium]|nr:hypothetical protein [Candidatus Competibacteraceae bacterium]